jgi:putative hemolysin
VTTFLNILVVLLLITVEGCFVLAEIALVSLREGQMRVMAEHGRRGAAVARLAQDPNRWLAASQIGITLTALLSSAFGAVTLSEEAAASLEDAGLGHSAARAIGIIGVTLIITFVTLVIGELVPKRLGLQRPERMARAFAPILDRVAKVSRPIIWVLSKTTDVIVRVFGVDPKGKREGISEEELRGLVAAHESLDADERRLIDEVFSAGERSVREVMVPRTEVEFLDAATTLTAALKATKTGTHSRYPVVRGSNDEIVGFVHMRDLIGLSGARRVARVGDVAREVKLVPGTKKVLPTLSEMRREGHHLAVVVDEYGGTDGIVTLEDLIEEVIGDIRDEYDVEPEASRTLRGGDVDVDGLLNLDEFEEQTGVTLPEGPYETVAGFVMARLGHVPKIGEEVAVEGATLKVTALDGRRIERVRVSGQNGHG